MIRKFYRKSETMDLNGYTSRSTFHDAIDKGDHPPPDGYIGPRTPIWFETTIEAHQAKVIAANIQPIKKPNRKKLAVTA